MQQPVKPAHEQLTQYRDQLANDLLRVEQSVSLLWRHKRPASGFWEARQPNSPPPCHQRPCSSHTHTPSPAHQLSCMLLSCLLLHNTPSQIMDMESNYFNAEHSQTGNVLKVCATQRGCPDPTTIIISTRSIRASSTSSSNESASAMRMAQLHLEQHSRRDSTAQRHPDSQQHQPHALLCPQPECTTPHPSFHCPFSPGLPPSLPPSLPCNHNTPNPSPHKTPGL